jgi:hypothetical protein
MDSGWAAIIGSAVGGIGTFAATWLSGYLNRKRPDPSEEAAKTLLRKMLEAPQWKWRRIKTLANVVGTDEATVRHFLLEIGARGSMSDPGHWGLVSRNPLGRLEDDVVKQEDAPKKSEGSGGGGAVLHHSEPGDHSDYVEAPIPFDGGPGRNP